MTDEKVIIAENLTKRFGNFVATDHISFSVRRGEIFGFSVPTAPARLRPCACSAD